MVASRWHANHGAVAFNNRAASTDACMENNDNQTAVTSVVPKGLDEVEHEAHPTGVSAKTLDAASSKGVEEASGHGDAGVTKEGLPQEKDTIETQSEAQDATAAESKASGSGATSTTQSYVPPVKRFSAVNINKKFLQKNQSSTAASAGTSSSSAGGKQAGVIGAYTTLQLQPHFKRT